MLHDCFGPCFRLMLRLPDSPPTGRTDVRREAEQLLEGAERLALRGREAATVETARRMVEAWMDETALGIAWEGRTAWLGNPLQRRWRTGRRGGDWFFDEIRRLSPHRAEDAELAGVALRCLGFGFRGHFYNDPNGLSHEHRALAERFGCTAVPHPFPPTPHLPRENRLIRYAGPLLAGLFAVLLLIFWGIWQHRLNREYTGSPQVPAVSAVHPASDGPRTNDARSAGSLSPRPSSIQEGQKTIGTEKQPIPDVYGELRNRLAGRTLAPASHDPGQTGTNNPNTTPGRSS